MLSSDPRQQPAAAPVASYAFQQLDAPPPRSAEEIADVLSAVRAEADRIREEARAAGEAEGRAAGIAAAQQAAQPALAALAAAAGAVNELRAQLAAEAEQDAVELAIRIAEQILAGAIEVQPERVVDVARNALRHLIDRRHVTLVVNPADLELVSDAVETSLTARRNRAPQRPGRPPGRPRRRDCARTEAGDIDAGVPTQLSRAREIAMAALSPESADAA